MAKKDMAAVHYRWAECCFHCQTFMPPDAPAVLGICSRVRGKVHPGDVCNLFQWTADDEDDDNRPDDREHTEATAQAAGALLMSEN